MRPVRHRGWAVGTAATGTVLIGAGAFWLSFTALADLARRSGIAVGQAWLWPLLVDGLIVVATVAVVALDGHRAAWYPWTLLVAGAGMSVTANAVHALVTAEASVPGILAAMVAAVPPLVLLASTHLTVVLIRSTRPTTAPPSAGPPADELPPDGLSATTGRPALPPRVETAEIPAENTPAEALAPELISSSSPGADLAVAGVDRRACAGRLREAGWSNKRIARELGVHPSTVGRWHLPPVHDPLVAELPESSSPDGPGNAPDQMKEDAS